MIVEGAALHSLRSAKLGIFANLPATPPILALQQPLRNSE
jgi:hypothetical protein